MSKRSGIERDSVVVLRWHSLTLLKASSNTAITTFTRTNDTVSRINPFVRPDTLSYIRIALIL